MLLFQFVNSDFFLGLEKGGTAALTVTDVIEIFLLFLGLKEFVFLQTFLEFLLVLFIDYALIFHRLLGLLIGDDVLS
jgi:hypothetical protein